MENVLTQTQDTRETLSRVLLFVYGELKPTLIKKQKRNKHKLSAMSVKRYRRYFFVSFLSYPPHLSYIRGVRPQQTRLRLLCLYPQSAHNSERKV